MVFRWQIWFLVSFLAVASWSLYNSMTSFGKGEAVGQANWEMAVKNHQVASLQEFCEKKGVTSTEKEPAIFSEAPFSADNPLFCSPIVEQARKSYGLYTQTQAKEASIRLTFQFIGVWIAILLLAFLISKLFARKSKK